MASKSLIFSLLKSFRSLFEKRNTKIQIDKCTKDMISFTKEKIQMNNKHKNIFSGHEPVWFDESWNEEA
jgi:hypothetical protein